MTQLQPRIPPVSQNVWDDTLSELAGEWDPHGVGHNAIATVGQHPLLLEHWLSFGSHAAGVGNTVSPRLRELGILRISWNCKANYVWGEHVRIAREEGMTDLDFLRIAVPEISIAWSPIEAAVLRAADEIWAEAKVSDKTWAALSRELGTQELLDLLFSMGHYLMVSVVFASIRLRSESADSFPDTSGRVS